MNVVLLLGPGVAGVALRVAPQNLASIDAAVSKVDDANSQVFHAWTALDAHWWYDWSNASHWWYEFVDGWAHGGGKHVFDGTAASKMNGQGGDFSGLLLTEYQKYSNVSELQERWTIDRVLQLNLGLRNATCNKRLCLNQYSIYVPRGTPGNDLPIDAGPVHNILGDRINNQANLTVADKRSLLIDALNFYYKSLGAATIDQRAWATPRRAMGGTLLPLATLYATMAEIHAFQDANSRTRTFVLLSELTRLGGHPLLLPDTGWAVYHMANESVVEQFILHGWCAWKRAYDNGVSPYLVLGWNASWNDKGQAGPAIEAAENLAATFYDAEEDVCV